MVDKAFIDSISAGVGELLAEADSGNKVPHVTCTIEFVLGPEHLAEYAEASGNLETTQKSDEKDVQVLRARHHSVARLLAAGLPEGIVAELTDFTAPYISTLKNNPSMAQLIAHYRAGPTAAAEAIAEKLRSVGTQALARLESQIEKLDSNQLLALAKLGLDRSGHGPQSKMAVEHEHRIFDVAEIAKIALEARRRQGDRIIPLDEIRRQLPKAEGIEDAA